MNIQKYLKISGIWLGLSSLLLHATPAAAEVALVDKDGWRFTFDGRINAFMSVGKGDDFPKPTPNPNAPTMPHTVMGSNKAPGTPDVGWKSSEVQDANGNRHPGVFVGMNEAAGWFGGGPSAYVVHPEAHQAEVVSMARIIPKG